MQRSGVRVPDRPLSNAGVRSAGMIRRGGGAASRVSRGGGMGRSAAFARRASPAPATGLARSRVVARAELAAGSGSVPRSRRRPAGHDRRRFIKNLPPWGEGQSIPLVPKTMRQGECGPTTTSCRTRMSPRVTPDRDASGPHPMMPTNAIARTPKPAASARRRRFATKSSVSPGSRHAFDWASLHRDREGAWRIGGRACLARPERPAARWQDVA